jgi:hypothetical protein
MNRLALFETSLATYPPDPDRELDRELTRRLVAESESSPGIARSNVGGWHSIPDLSQRPEPCYQTIMQRVVAGTRALLVKIARSQDLDADLRYRYGIQAWAMVMRDGDYTVVHDHAHAHFSVAYYADAGDADPSTPSGQLTFVDPRRTGATVPGLDLYPAQFAITPETGMLVVFPGFLQHFVHAYRGTRPRVTISANVQLELDPTAS